MEKGAADQHGYRVSLGHLAAGGAALGRLPDGRVLFVDLAAPGDLAEIRITEEHRSWARGELLDILNPGSERIRPLCPYYGSCGGCGLQHLAYGAQLEEKAAILCDALSRIGGLRDLQERGPALRIIPSAEYGYRNRVQFHGTAQGAAHGAAHGAGFKARKSETIIPIEDCPVADAGIRRRLKTGGIIPPAGRDRFTVYSRGELFLQEGDGRLGRVSILGRDIIMEAGVFFQSNAAMLELLAGELLDIADGADPGLALADIYAGVGTFAALLGDKFKRIDLIEANHAALDLARINAPGEGNRFFARRDGDWLRSFLGQTKRGAKQGPSYGFALADPPRQGLSPGMAAWLAASGPPVLAYLSCNPASLGRDSGILAAGGYELASLSFYDFYPQTAHIESLAVFRRPEAAV
ncbi:MAG: TRAM domain-containing protein [Treponema sp.]|jgi:23S rRNA (uracil1939-C5)-methyltransferase|nr:TRAM domain-containing protein [Treponema sp.]